jgi:hypothetical protein
MLGEEVHKESLGRLGLVNDGLGTDVKTTDRLGVNVVLLKEVRDDCTVSTTTADRTSRRVSNLPVRATELMSSVSSVKAMYFWPRPMVYFPLETPSNSSRASSEMQRLGKYISMAWIPTLVGRWGMSKAGIVERLVVVEVIGIKKSGQKTETK